MVESRRISNWPVVGAILVGSCIISAGLYFGLSQNRQSSPPALVQPAPPAAQSGAHAESLLLKAPPPPSSPALPATLGAAAMMGAMDGPSEAPPATAPVPVPEPGAQLSPAQVQALALERIHQHKATLIQKCWDPVKGQKGAPDHVELTLDATIGPDGEILAMGSSENRKANWPGVATCVRQEVAPLKFQGAPGPVRIRVPITIP